MYFRSDKLVRKFAEVLENDDLGTRPLREAKCTDIYAFKGDKEREKYCPRFTFHGSRYCQIEGLDDNYDYISNATALFMSTNLKPTGDFKCNLESLNKLHSNVIRSTRGNFLSIPTDCPQRDERLGWTGYLTVFAPRANYLFNTIPMLSNWLKDIWEEQVLNKDYKDFPYLPPITIHILKGIPNDFGDIVTSIWQDCTVIVPMVRWDAVGHQFGDWLDPSAPPNEPFKAMIDSLLVSDAFLFRILVYIVRICDILDYKEDLQNVRKIFQDEYLTPSGRVVSDSQTAYALSICFELIDNEKQLHRAGDRLAEIVRSNKYKISTGFAGTPFGTHALYKTGHLDVAYSMLLQEECPSWLYPVSMEATTIWERWDSMLPDGTINPGDMVSFNHYSLGSIANFMHEIIGGIK